MEKQQFGGNWIEEKLMRLRKYLIAFKQWGGPRNKAGRLLEGRVWEEMPVPRQSVGD